jgi:hypothetical protein
LPNINNHRARCAVCRHPQREEIERDLLDWINFREVARTYKLSSHMSAYRHARALGLLHKRRHNLLAALDRIIEHAATVKPSASAVVSAIRLATSINTDGEWVEPGDRVYLKELFDRMTPEELEDYAREGKLPAWFNAAISAARSD